jgi:hypothetical protein
MIEDAAHSVIAEHSGYQRLSTILTLPGSCRTAIIGSDFFPRTALEAKAELHLTPRLALTERLSSA